MAKDWKGDIVFTDTMNMAIFRGHVSSNDPHSHWASQITIALEDDLVFKTTTGEQSSKAVYFPSKTQHQLLSGFICSIYFDPLYESSLKQTLDQKANNGFASLSLEELPYELQQLNATTNLRSLISSEIFHITSHSGGKDAESNERLALVIQEIKSKLSDPEKSDRDTLANLANLSPSRFSHWFVEQTGVPLRSYKKWLKLRVAMEAILDGKLPTDAAILAGFYDLAHMSHAFSESFGLTYLDALRTWEQANKT